VEGEGLAAAWLGDVLELGLGAASLSEALAEALAEAELLVVGVVDSLGAGSLSEALAEELADSLAEELGLPDMLAVGDSDSDMEGDGLSDSAKAKRPGAKDRVKTRSSAISLIFSFC
jgi:hypothetical protein